MNDESGGPERLFLDFQEIQLFRAILRKYVARIDEYEDDTVMSSISPGYFCELAEEFEAAFARCGQRPGVNPELAYRDYDISTTDGGYIVRSGGALRRLQLALLNESYRVPNDHPQRQLLRAVLRKFGVTAIGMVEAVWLVFTPAEMDAISALLRDYDSNWESKRMYESKEHLFHSFYRMFSEAWECFAAGIQPPFDDRYYYHRMTLTQDSAGNYHVGATPSVFLLIGYLDHEFDPETWQPEWAVSVIRKLVEARRQVAFDQDVPM